MLPIRPESTVPRMMIQICNGSEKGVRCDSKSVRFDFEIVLYDTKIVPFDFKIVRYDVEIVHCDPENTVLSFGWVIQLINLEMFGWSFYQHNNL
jgi:hypothetical protein